nr:GNAT family N-acetyltransferase [Cytophagales bacterium]
MGDICPINLNSCSNNSILENNPIEIKAVALPVVLKVRREVMWPDKPIEFVHVPGDEKAEHLGIYLGETVVSVVSLFFDGNEVQFRKFATLTTLQGKGYGTTLLAYVFEYLKSKRIRRVTCNAREERASFYARFGMTPTEVTFKKDHITYIVMEKVTDE